MSLGSAPAGRPRFGTDGVRGLANEIISPEYALAFGRASARVFRSTADGGPETFFVGRDTRLSGAMIEAALCAGLASEGAHVVRLGVCPTPAVAWLAARDGVAGVVISASHNPFQDNGIKLFAPGGLKLANEEEQRLEDALATLPSSGRGSGAAIGTFLDGGSNLQEWAEALVGSIDGRSFTGLRVVIDCGHGAAYSLAPAVLRRLGASVDALGTDPDGININAGCGSTDLRPLSARVVKTGADLGLAFDGDADRVLAVDAQGQTVDGDELIAMCAIDRKAQGRLPQDTVVVTVMANQGFRLGMAAVGILISETAVGDRNVLERLEQGGWALGGEQSGHVIFRELATTGDGLLTGIQVLDLMARRGMSLRSLAEQAMTRQPQVLHNVRLGAHPSLDAPELAERLAPLAAEVQPRLQGGRVLIRPSGTEPLLRVMVEAPDRAVAERVAAELVAAAEALLR